MSVRADNINDQLQRTTSLPVSTAGTICGWARMVSNRGAVFQCLAGLENAGGTSWHTIGWDDTSFEVSSSSGAPGVFASAPTEGEWFFFAMVMGAAGAGNLDGYWKHNLADAFVTASATSVSFTPATLTFFNTVVDEWFDGELRGIKVFDAALTELQLTQEARQSAPLRQTSIHLWNPLNTAATSTTDFSLNARTMTEGGTLTDGASNPSETLLGIYRISQTASATTGSPGRTGNGDLTITLPTWSDGDFAFILLYNDQGDGSTPDGWTEVTGSPWGSATPKIQAFYRFMVAGDSNPVTTISGSGTNVSHVAAVIVVRGVDTTTIIDVVGAASAGTGTPMTCGGVTTLTKGALLLGLCGRGDNEAASGQTVNASSEGVVEVFDAGTSEGNDSEVSLYIKGISPEGATGNGSATTSATDPWVSVFVALKPAPVETLTSPVVLWLAEDIAFS